ncbi:MAG: hypothetical protein WCK58_00340 [Chloroflexota bacterium]
MQALIEEFATADSPETFWGNLSALLTDEIVIAEAQAAGMDWPEFAEGRERLRTTRKVIVRTAASQGWVAGDQRRLFLANDPAKVMAAARPWIEQVERIAFERAEVESGLLAVGEPGPATGQDEVAAPA